MASIQIRHPHSLGISAALASAKQFEELMARFGVKLRWEGNRADVKGTGVAGVLTVNEADINVELELGMLLKPMTGKLEASIKEYLAQATGKAAG